MVGLLVMRVPESFAGNLSLLLVALVVALVVGPVASAIVRLPWRQRGAASVAFALALALLVATAAHGPALQLAKAVFIECSCEWWNILCCLI